MDIAALLDRDAVVSKAHASSKRQALTFVADMAGKRFGRPAAPVLEALLEREQAGSTGVGHGVAVPHAPLSGLDRMRAVFVRLEQPVAFDAVDDRPVDLLFALFAPEQAGVDHLRALARVSRLLRQTDMREQLRQARTADALYALLARVSEPNAA